MELHVFVDGSEEAYAMGAYLRSKHSGHIGPSPVTATATVAPLKAITIPRMRPSVVDRQNEYAMTWNLKQRKESCGATHRQYFTGQGDTQKKCKPLSPVCLGKSIN